MVNVWARGSGQASFSLNITNGQADLQLGFQLGLPTDAHLPHQHPVPVPQPNLPYQDHKTFQGRRKTPSQRKRDQARAAQHRAATAYHPGSAVAAAPNKSEAASAPVLLPFHGKILPLHSPSQSVSSEKSPATAAVASPFSSDLSIPAPTAPTKTVGTTSGEPKQCVDVSTAKKNLFPAGHQCPPQQDLPSRSFQEREKKLWTKLFSI